MGTNLFEYINPRYLQGVSDEPSQLLLPIAGYAGQPLLPIEEACEPLLPIVPRLPTYIWIAKENSKNPADGLTQDESAAIRLYTMEWDVSDNPRASLYSNLNRTLKMVDRTKLRPWFRYLKLFLTALAKLPASPRQTVWRGVRKDHSVDYPPGSEATWWAFSSCTTSLSVLESDLYLGNTGTRTLFSIETFNARTVRNHSHFTTEDEILLLPGTHFEVKSRLNPAPDLHIVHLSQKIPPHDLLEPPFEGAHLIPRAESIVSMDIDIKSEDIGEFYTRPWYKKKRLGIAIASAVVAIILTVILAAVLGTQIKGSQSPSKSTGTSGSKSGSILPPSVADAFYAFDGNADDLYRLHDGVPNGDSVNYVQGYVATGQAVVLTQTQVTCADIPTPFNVTGMSYTVEAFVIAQVTNMTGNLLEITSFGAAMGLEDGYLNFRYTELYRVRSKEPFPVNEWHHVGFVYDVINRYANIYFDGILIASTGYANPPAASLSDLALMKIGSKFDGTIDQVSISLAKKTDAAILWDATVAAYYPFSSASGFLLDSGPNLLNATSQNTQIVKGFCGDGLHFNTLDTRFQSNGFTALGTPKRPFTLALWIRPESTAGAFLTVANPSACLLVLGLRSSDNRLVAFLPNSTATGGNINIVGPVLSPNQWAHVTLTWSDRFYAQLYKSGIYQNSSDDVTAPNNGRGGPMTVTLGAYNGKANCQGGDGLSSSQQFIGTFDEIYVYARELSQWDLQEYFKTPCP